MNDAALIERLAATNPFPADSGLPIDIPVRELVLEEIFGDNSTERVRRGADARRTPLWQRLRGLRVLVATAIVVVALIGVAAWIGSFAGDGGPATDPPTTTTVTTTTVTTTTVTTTTTTPPVLDSAEWIAIDSLPVLAQVLGDGSGFLALEDRGETPELFRSEDGVSWRSLGPMPFTRIEAAADGRLVAAGETGTTLFLVDDAGTISESSVPSAGPARIARFVEGGDLASVTFGPGGVMVTSAAGVEIALVLMEATERSRDEVELGLGGMSVGEGIIEAPQLGVTVDVRDLGLEPKDVQGDEYVQTFWSSDGDEWVEITEPAGSIDAVVAVADGFVAIDVADRELFFSADGASWSPVSNPAGQAVLSDAWSVFTSHRGAIVVANEALWTLTSEGLVRLDLDVPEGELQLLDGFFATAGSDLVYLTGFSVVDGGGGSDPRELRFSRQGGQLVSAALPDSIGVVLEAPSVGGDGVVLLDVDGTAWFFAFPD